MPRPEPEAVDKPAKKGPPPAGALKLQMAVVENRLILNFGKPIELLSLSTDELRYLGNYFLEKADKIEADQAPAPPTDEILPG